MKLLLCLSILLACVAAGVPSVAAATDYWVPTCTEGARLEQNKRKAEFRCARAGGEVKEYAVGRCKRPLRLSKSGRPGDSFGCTGTTISRQGDTGTSESLMPYACPDGFEKERRATAKQKTCVREVPGVVYEAPVFTAEAESRR